MHSAFHLVRLVHEPSEAEKRRFWADEHPAVKAAQIKMKSGRGANGAVTGRWKEIFEQLREERR